MSFQLGALAQKVLLAAIETTTASGTATDMGGSTVEIGNSQMIASLISTSRTYTGTPSVIVTITQSTTSAMSSPDTLCTFSTIATTAATSELKAITPTKQYLQATATFDAATTTGSYVVAVFYTKREI